MTANTASSQLAPTQAAVSTLVEVVPHRLVRDLFQQMTIHGVGESYARRCLAPVAVSRVIDGLSALTENIAWRDRVAAASYRHANGFYKIPLFTSHGARLRLHYWDGTTPAEENIHNHRWKLASRVLLGALEDETYQVCAPGEPGALRLNEFVYRKTGPDQATVSRCLGRPIRLNARTTRMAGAAYALNPRALHRIVTRPGAPTMTLMMQSAAVFPFNAMFTRDEVSDPNVERTSLTPGHLLLVVRQIVDLLSQERADVKSARRD